MKKTNGPLREEGQFYEAEENGRTRTHIQILGIDFAIEEGVPATDTLREILRKAAEAHIQRPAIASAYRGKIGYSAASPEKIEGIPPEHRRKAVVSGIETELLAASDDGTPVPALAQEHVEQAAKEVWLHRAYVALAADEFPWRIDPDAIAVMFPSHYQIISIKKREGA